MELGFEHDEFGIVVPLDIGERANLAGLSGASALNAIPLNGHHIPNGGEHHWPTVNLADPAYAIPPDPPAIAGLLYEGKRHVASGPQESAKTLIAYHLLLSAMRQGMAVAIIDLEMGPIATRRMLCDLGATDAELASIVYTEPNGPPTPADIETMARRKVRFVLIDAAAGAFDITGLDDNSRKDAEKWANLWVQPLFKLGISTITLDHVTKNAETRGKYAIGSERKTGGADVHLGFEALRTLTRGGQGIVKVTAHKDRGAYMPRPTVAIIELSSDPTTHAVTVNIKPPEEPGQGIVHLTIYAERISETLANNNTETMSQSQVEETVSGAREHIRTALAQMVQAGYVTIETGPRNAKNYSLAKPFRKDEYDPAGTPPAPRPGEVTHHADSPRRIPFRESEAGSGGVGDDTADQTTPPDTFDVYDPTIQHLLDQPDY